MGSKPQNCHLPGAGTRWAKPEPSGCWFRGEAVGLSKGRVLRHTELVGRISPDWGLLSSTSLHHAISGWTTGTLAGPQKTEDAGGWGGQQSGSGRGSVCEIRCVLSWVILWGQGPHALLCPPPTRRCGYPGSAWTVRSLMAWRVLGEPCVPGLVPTKSQRQSGDGLGVWRGRG